MTSIRKEEAREEPIIMEVVVDAYGPEERAVGWYCYSMTGAATPPSPS